MLRELQAMHPRIDFALAQKLFQQTSQKLVPARWHDLSSLATSYGSSSGQLTSTTIRMQRYDGSQLNSKHDHFFCLNTKPFRCDIKHRFKAYTCFRKFSACALLGISEKHHFTSAHTLRYQCSAPEMDTLQRFVFVFLV